MSTVATRSRDFLRLVRIEHSVFALPFAYLAALTAMTRHGGHVRWLTLLIVTVAMVGARTFAMAANRIIDRHIDAQNPRTAERELVTGALSVRTAWIGALVALVVFPRRGAAAQPAVRPAVPAGRRPPDHLPVRQAVHRLPAGRARDRPDGGTGRRLARGHRQLRRLRPGVRLSVGVGLWIGGFDLIYASQDAEVDRVIGVRSVPARFGVRAALHASSVVHLLAFGLFVWFGQWAGFGWLWWIGLALTAASFVYQHAIVKPDDLSRANRAFFTANGFVGIALFVFALADLVFLQHLRG